MERKVCKMWLTDTNFLLKKNFEVENLKWYFWEIFCPWKIFLSANGLFRVNMQVDYMIFKTSIISTWKPCHVTFETQHRLSEFILTGLSNVSFIITKMCLIECICDGIFLDSKPKWQNTMNWWHNGRMLRRTVWKQ